MSVNYKAVILRGVEINQNEWDRIESDYPEILDKYGIMEDEYSDEGSMFIAEEIASVEQGSIRLDDDFKVITPSTKTYKITPNSDISLKRILTHIGLPNATIHTYLICKCS